MYSGIVRHLGEIKEIKKNITKGSNDLELVISSKLFSELQENKKLNLGDSVSVSGACLTVVNFVQDSATFQVSPETLAKTNFGDLNIGSKVNLEIPLSLQDLIHGHLVSGHIDTVTELKHIQDFGDHHLLEIALPKDLAKYIVEKGSVALDGVGLTVAKVEDESFYISMIPYTFQNTTFCESHEGKKLNLEIDLIARYLEGFTRK